MRTRFGKQSKWFNDVTSSALILILISALAHYTQLFSRVDYLLYDIGQSLITKPAPKDVVIVAIDENSLSELGRWPWPRRTHAQLIQTLAPEEPAAIGFDIILAEQDRVDLEGDAALVDSMQLSGKVVLPVLIERTRNNGQLVETLPFNALMEVAADVGSVHTVLDEDSIARSVYRYEGLNTPAWQLFAQAVLNVAYDLPSKNHFIQDDTLSPSLFSVARKDHVGVNFSGPPGHFQTISYAQVIKGEFVKGTFKNKIILVGATAAGMNDMLSTPVSGLSVPMPGVEFHANTLESIRSHSLIRHIPFYVSMAIVVLLSIIPLLWMPKLTALNSFLATFFYGVFVLLLAGILPKWLGFWVPAAAAVFAISLAYPLWSWRKLEAAQQYLNNELDYLNQNLHGSNEESKVEYVDHFDRFDARISRVREAAKQLRSLQNDRKETLAFISHDIRAPLKAALNLVEEIPADTARLNQFLSQAHYLAEDFLQASRAEMMQKSGFQEVDVVSLAHQCIDAAYDMAKQKNIQLVRVVYEGSIWVDANFGLLERAFLNLILNAIKFSPDNKKVEVRCHLLDDGVVFSVTDFGPGIPQVEQKQLFKRFSRLDGSANKEGSGLGLYFVKVVAEKHGGDADVNSIVGEFTTFNIHLPVVASQLHG